MTSITKLNGVPNFRDVGGLPLVQGGATRAGILYRSAALHSITAEGLTELANSDIGVIADLRTKTERSMQPDKLPTSRTFVHDSLPITAGSLSPDTLEKLLPQNSAGVPSVTPAELKAELEKSIPSVAEMYIQMLGEGAPEFAAVARLTSQVSPNRDNAVLVHCTAGKDRTGIACALILSVVGVERNAVVANYAQSQKNLAGPWADSMLAMLKKFGLPLVPPLVDIVTTTPPSAMEHALDWVDQSAGGPEEYLLSGGLTGGEIDQLRAALA